MISNAQLINYYPKYQYLDDLLSKTGCKKINFFIDLKGCCQSLYQEWAIRYIVDQTRGSTHVDCSVFGAFLEFISFHKQYVKKRNIKADFYVFYEHGDSAYHKNIDKNYKANRGLTDFFDLDEIYKDTFFKVFTKNLNTIERVGNKLPNVHIYRLEWLEADFIPYYLLNYVIKDQPENLNIIYSMDKDMLQCLKLDRTYQYFRHPTHHTWVNKDNIYKHHLKDETLKEIDCEYFPVLLAILGDSSDNIPKYVDGVGNKMFIQHIYPNLEKMCGTPDEMYKNLKENNRLFKINSYGNKYIDKVLQNEKDIIKNFRLTSFRLLSEYLDGQFPLEILEKKKIIWNVTSNTQKINQAVILYNALQTIGLGDLVTENTISSLFW